MKIDADERELLESVERGEWKSAGGGKRVRAPYSRYAKATFRKDRRLNIRLSSKDPKAIQKGDDARIARRPRRAARSSAHIIKGIGDFLPSRDDHSSSQVEPITLLEEVVRLAVMQLAITDSDASARPADHFKLIRVDDGSCPSIHADAQQAWIRGYNASEIPLPARALIDVDVDRRVR